MPKELTSIFEYMESMSQRESWKNTYYTEKVGPLSGYSEVA